MVVFMLASVLAGSAQGAVVLIGARLLQGIGASAILTTTLSTMNSIFRGRERGIAFAVYGSTIGGMAAVGPLVGGWLATDVSWRWAFWLNIPFGPVSYTHLDVYKRQRRSWGPAEPWRCRRSPVASPSRPVAHTSSSLGATT